MSQVFLEAVGFGEPGGLDIPGVAERGLGAKDGWFITDNSVLLGNPSYSVMQNI